MQAIWLRAASAVACGSVLAFGVPAYGQESEDSSGGLGEIVVTAEKRPSTEQKTPIALSVLSAETLTRNGVGNIGDLSGLAPGVSVALTGAAPIVAVRGVSSRDTTEIGDPAVSLSIDGFNLQRASGLGTAFFDLERIEVLRGPQGTLLGRNATGGAINVITAKPTDEFAAYIGGELGSYDLYATKAMVNLPVTDTLAVRAAFQTRDRNGYRNNPGKDGDDEHSKGARIHLLYKPTSRLNILLTGEYAHDSAVGNVVQGIPWKVYTAADTPAGFIAGDINLGTPDRGNAKDFDTPSGGYMRYTVWNIRSQIDYDFGFATLTYQGGWRKLDFSRLYAFGANPQSVRRNLSYQQDEALDTWNHEVRLSSNSIGRLKWQVGAFYFRERNDFVGNFTDYPDRDGMYGTPFLIARYAYPEILAKAKAVFGQASYEIVNGLTAEFGARYSKDDKTRQTNITTTNVSNYFATRCDLTASCVYTNTTGFQEASSGKTTVHTGLNYQVAPNNMIYAKFDTGYKAGGFTDIAPYDPETVKAYEIGAKNRFFGNTLQVNLSAYWYDYSNQQVNQAIVNASGGISAFILNAGKSRYKGIELDTVYAPTPEDRFNVYVGYSHARFVDFATSTSGQLLRLAQMQGAAEAVYNDAGTVVGYNYQLAGKRPPQAPDWTFNIGYEHDFHVLAGTLTPRLQSHIETKSYFQIYNLGSDRQKPYSRSDLTVTYVPDSQAWTLTAYVRNIEDRVILANAALPTSSTYGSYRETYQPPRTFGASLTFNW